MPTYDILPHNGNKTLFLGKCDVSQAVDVYDVVFWAAKHSIILKCSHSVRTYVWLNLVLQLIFNKTFSPMHCT